MNQDIKDKGIFVIGFLATVLAFTSFKDELASLHVSLGSFSFSISQAMVVFFVLLAISAYLYALDFMRYSFGRFQNFILFKWIAPLASFFFFLGMMMPLAVFLVWAISKIPFPNVESVEASLILLIVATLTSIVSLTITIVQFRLQKLKDIERVELAANVSLGAALKLFENGFYRETILEAQRYIEQFLRERLLVDKDLSSRHVPFSTLLKMAADNGLLGSEHVTNARMLNEVRNRAAHSSAPVGKEEAEAFMEETRKIIRTIGTDSADKENIKKTA